MKINYNTVLVALIALIVGALSGYALSDEGGWGRHDREHSRVHSQNDEHAMATGGHMHGHMSDEMGHMMAVESEREFIEEMIPHHQEAVDTAKEVIARGGTTPEIKALVEGIVIAQEKEIADMKSWYQTWYGEEYKDSGAYHAMMRDLSSLSGAELDKVFLEDMIRHHMGAIMMAKSIEDIAERQEIKDLVAAIIETQSFEIAKMRAMLQGL